MIQEIHSYAFGIGTKNSAGEIIEVFYPKPQIHPDKIAAQRLLQISGLKNTGYIELTEAQIALANRSFCEGIFVDQHKTFEGISAANTSILMLQVEDTAPNSIPEAFLKLHLLSHRLAEPNTINLDGLFGVLKNIAWTNEGPVDLTDLPLHQLEARTKGNVLNVESVDKFPKMTNYVVPPGVRIADTSRVRLGAYIGSLSLIHI